MSSKRQVLFAYCAFPDEPTAARVAELVVRERLAACANILGPMTSIYHWQGELQRERECAVIFKTTPLKKKALTERIRATHPYSVPGLVFLDVTGGWPEYLRWVASETI